MTDDRNRSNRAATGLSSRRWGAVAVFALSLAFFLTAAVLLWAKWLNFHIGLLDFAKLARNYEMLLQGVSYDYRALYYGYFYAGFLILVLPVYMLFRSVAVIFAVHLLAFTAAIPTLYFLARRRLPGVALPLAVAATFALSPTVDLLTLGVMRFEALWLLTYLLTVYCLHARRWRVAIWLAMLGCFLRLDGMPAFFLLGWLWRRDNRVVGMAIMRRSLLMAGLMVVAMIVFRVVSGISPELDQLHLGEGGAAALVARAAKSLAEPAGYRHLLIVLQVFLLPLLAPRWLLPAAASVLYILASASGFFGMTLVRELLIPGGWLVPSLHTHDTILLPILFVAMIEGLRRGLEWWEKSRGESYRVAPVAAAAIIVLATAAHWFGTPDNLGPAPLTPAFDRDAYRQTPHSRLAWKTLQSLPADRTGWLQFNFAERAWNLPRALEISPNTAPHSVAHYALFDLSARSVNMSKAQLLTQAGAFLTRPDFRVERFEDGILLLLRGVRDARSDAVLAAIAREEMP